MPMYRKKPVIIEAEHFTEENKNQCFNFITCNASLDFDAQGQPCIHIMTLEGWMTASLGDYVIKGIAGEFYPCKPDIFEATYEDAGVEL